MVHSTKQLKLIAMENEKALIKKCKTLGASYVRERWTYVAMHCCNLIGHRAKYSRGTEPWTPRLLKAYARRLADSVDRSSVEQRCTAYSSVYQLEQGSERERTKTVSCCWPWGLCPDPTPTREKGSGRFRAISWGKTTNQISRRNTRGNFLS